MSITGMSTVCYFVGNDDYWRVKSLYQNKSFVNLTIEIMLLRYTRSMLKAN